MSGEYISNFGTGEEIDAALTQVGEIANSLTTVSESVDSVSTDLTTLQSTVSTLGDDLTTLQSTVDGHASSLSDLDAEERQLIITSNRTYYVRTDGSDSNTGLENTAGGAFLTIQKAFDAIERFVIPRGVTVTVQLGDGSYVGNPILHLFDGGGELIIKGNEATPSNVILSGDLTVFAQRVTVSYFSIQGGSLGLLAQGCARVTVGAGMRFGAITTAQVTALDGGYITMQSPYTIYGNSGQHYLAGRGGIIRPFNAAVTISGSLTFTYFARAYLRGLIDSGGMTYSAAVTAMRYISDSSMISVSGGGANYFPGNVAGTTANGGVYV